MSTCINFSNFWQRLLDNKHSIWKKKLEAQFPTNQILNDKNKNKIIIKKDPFQLLFCTLVEKIEAFVIRVFQHFSLAHLSLNISAGIW
jgi:hypothetical protein